MKTIKNVLRTLIGIAFAVCLFAGGLGFIGFLVAFIMGGEGGAAICAFLKDTYYATLIKVATVTTLATFVYLYIDGKAKWINPINYWAKKITKRNITEE